MTTKTASSPERRSARERLLGAADELFYEEGIQTVGIDRIIERAGVAKASLYDLFGSKEELVRSYLQRRHELRQARMLERIARHEQPREQILSLFDAFAEVAANPKFSGCAFARAGAEARPDSSIKATVDESRAWTLALFTRLAADAGAADPQLLGLQLVSLYDGASMSAYIDRNPQAARVARTTAALLVDAAVAGPKRNAH
ncbi:MAG TPA: TetR/AcrR family transcriptional regulator [Dokdonella sp.]